AYVSLATLRVSDPRLTLSAADCAALEPLAAEWFARGVTPEAFARILCNGLPDVIYCPRAFTRKRLIDRLPPEPVPDPRAETGTREATPPPRWIMECAGCGVPGRPEALPGGLCRACRGVEPPPDAHDPVGVRARVARLRAMTAQGRRPAEVGQNAPQPHFA
ncbi:hypothetical protein ACSNOG_32200, partial [Streptomyces sp. URMC 124]